MAERINLGKIMVTLEGAWDSTRAYDKYCEVSHQGSSYVSKKSVPVGTLPTNTEYWQLRAQGTDGADEEDITTDANNLLKFKDRASATGQKGYVILRRGASLATQMADANTIYEIRYAFDLDGETLTIPSGCTLKFDGGRIINGCIDSDDLNVVADSKCFDNITFDGRFKSFGVVQLSWFIDEYPSSADDTTIDNTSDIQFVMDDSGAMNVEFPTDKYLRITRTIDVQRAVNIIAKNGQKRIPETQSAVSGNRLPCVFSKNVVTLFDYNIKGIDGTDATNSFPINIGAINLYVDCEYNDLSDKTTPIIKFKTNYSGSVYGLVFDANIVSKRYEVTIGTDTDNINNYTGILIDIYKGSLSYIKINGTIFGTYYGVVTNSTTSNPSSNWITDITINGNTWCCYGGKFDAGYPIIIYGSHQCAVTDTDQSNPLPYFKGNQITLYGKIWDSGGISPISGLKRAALPLSQTTSEVYLTNQSNSAQRPMGILKSYSNPSLTGVDLIRNMPINVQNLFNLHRTSSGIVKSLTYTINGDDVFTSGDVFNTDKIFNSNVLGSSLINASPTYFSDAYFVPISTPTTLSFVAVIDKTLAGFTDADYAMLLYFRHYRSANSYTITITHSSDNSDFTSLISDSGSGLYYGTLTKVYNLDDAERYVKISLTITQSDTKPLILPTLIIPSIAETDVRAFGTTAQRPILKTVRRGADYYDTTLKRMIVWNGEKWIEEDGEEAGIARVGSISTANGLTPNRRGFGFYCTTISKMIFWTGSAWIEEDGEVAAIKRSGTFANKPTPTNVGFKYFCTSGASLDGGTTETANLAIYYTGSGWVDGSGNSVVEKS